MYGRVCGGTLRVIACIETPLKCRSRSELARSSRESSPEDRKNNPSICVAGRVSRWQFASPVPPVAVSPPVAQATVTVLALTAPGIIV